jgi:hypothetical protein
LVICSNGKKFELSRPGNVLTLFGAASTPKAVAATATATVAASTRRRLPSPVSMVKRINRSIGGRTVTRRRDRGQETFESLDIFDYSTDQARRHSALS